MPEESDSSAYRPDHELPPFSGPREREPERGDPIFVVDPDAPSAFRFLAHVWLLAGAGMAPPPTVFLVADVADTPYTVHWSEDADGWIECAGSAW